MRGGTCKRPVTTIASGARRRQTCLPEIVEREDQVVLPMPNEHISQIMLIASKSLVEGKSKNMGHDGMRTMSTSGIGMWGMDRCSGSSFRFGSDAPKILGCNREILLAAMIPVKGREWRRDHFGTCHGHNIERHEHCHHGIAHKVWSPQGHNSVHATKVVYKRPPMAHMCIHHPARDRPSEFPIFTTEQTPTWKATSSLRYYYRSHCSSS